MGFEVLRDLYLKARTEQEGLGSLDRTLVAFWGRGELDFSEAEAVLVRKENVDELTPFQRLEAWRDLLTLQVLSEISETQPKLEKALNEALNRLQYCPSWPQFQLEEAYQYLSSALSGSRRDGLYPKQSKSGAAPFEWGGHWSWAGVPHAVFHAELGVLWFLIGQRLQQATFVDAANRVAQWQMNVLDSQYRPMPGLFVQEKDANQSQQILGHYLLFHCAALWGAHSENGVPSSASNCSCLQGLGDKEDLEISPLFVLLSQWVEQWKSTPQPHFTPLNEVVCDPNTALVAYRNGPNTVASTLVGGGTGLGHFWHEDIGIVNFGPQQFPIEDCRGFGIERACNIEQAHQGDLSIDLEGRDYTLQGRVKVTGAQPACCGYATFGNSRPSGVFMDTVQNYSQGQLSVSASFYGVKALDKIAFSFFAKASVCSVDGDMDLHPCSLERYGGEIRPLFLGGATSKIQLEAQHRRGEMQVVSLAGGANFWGADFLVTYFLDSKPLTYCWELAAASK